eukprot:8678381-Pyramimonas_sp.AAC.1
MRNKKKKKTPLLICKEENASMPQRSSSPIVVPGRGFGSRHNDLFADSVSPGNDARAPLVSIACNVNFQKHGVRRSASAAVENSPDDAQDFSDPNEDATYAVASLISKACNVHIKQYRFRRSPFVVAEHFAALAREFQVCSEDNREL